MRLKNKMRPGIKCAYFPEKGEDEKETEDGSGFWEELRDLILKDGLVVFAEHKL
jgi:hypothetical protein